jgi:hypothetical protein
MIVASPGHYLVSCDSSAIEAVLVGYCAGSELVIRLARAGIHGWLTAAYHGQPIPLSLSDADLAAACKEAKHRWGPVEYDRFKRVIYLSFYMGTPERIFEEYPEQFEDVAQARKLQNFLFETDPGRDIRRWQRGTLERAHQECRLDSHFGWRAWFWSVFQWDKKYQKWRLGDDAKRAVALVPQSDASSIQTEILLTIEDQHPWLLDYLRLIIHDDITSDIRADLVDESIEPLHRSFTQPWPQLQGLSIGAEIKVGKNAADYDPKTNVNGMKEIKL